MLQLSFRFHHLNFLRSIPVVLLRNKMTLNLDFHNLPRNPKLSESFDIYMVNGFSLPSFAIKFLKTEALNFQARDDDIYVISYPKTGTTWTQEIVYLIHSNLNFEAAKSKGLHERFPYVEHAMTDINTIVNMQSPRLLKSHLPYSLLPPDIIKRQYNICDQKPERGSSVVL